MFGTKMRSPQLGFVAIASENNSDRAVCYSVYRLFLSHLLKLATISQVEL
ncbi:hypothetical protein [Microcoleus sp. FACHB-SPT15]|nr:hypothetical protein [Microcoleus sp. FACHB-SPT15]